MLGAFVHLFFPIVGLGLVEGRFQSMQLPLAPPQGPILPLAASGLLQPPQSLRELSTQVAGAG